uniref:Midkine n=1 Tax=Bos indicus x Bos taurus TaxID=30522 RepID=A0A4W2EKV2_BOBOX
GWGLRACPGPDLGQAAGLAGAGGGASFLQLPASRWDDNNESERGGAGARPGFLCPVALWLGKPPPPGLHHSGSYGDLRRRCPRTRLTRGGHLQPLQGRIWNFSDGSCLLLSLNQTPACGLLLPQLPPPPARPLQLALREERTPPQHGVEHLPGPLVKRSKAGLVLLPQHLRVAESLAGPGRWRGGTRRGSSLHPPGAGGQSRTPARTRAPGRDLGHTRGSVPSSGLHLRMQRRSFLLLALLALLALTSAVAKKKDKMKKGGPGSECAEWTWGPCTPSSKDCGVGFREGTCGAQTQRIRCRVPCNWKKEFGADCKYKFETWGACDGGTGTKARQGTLKKARYNAQCQETIRVTKPCSPKTKAKAKAKKGKEKD